MIYTNNNLANKIKEQLDSIKCFNALNSDNWKLSQKKIISSTGNCIEKCSDHPIYKFEYNGKCFNNCSLGYITDKDTNTQICKCELEKCLHCPPVALLKKLCTVCNEGFYPKKMIL